jgi:hypothetical protein
MALRVVICAVALALLSSGLAEAGSIASGSVRVDSGDDMHCIIPNVGTTKVKQVDIAIVLNKSDGTLNGIASAPCTNVEPQGVCNLTTNTSAGDHSMYCTITFTNGKVRGTLCNLTKGLCADLR